MNSQDIEKLLVERCKYTEKQAVLVTKELVQIDPILIPLFNKWVEEGVETNFMIEGFSLYELMSTYNMTYPAALLTIDWLVKEPIIAKEAIKQGLK